MRLRRIEMKLAEPDMTPMIDIVFQLLLFFMIAVSFENTKADERIKLPKDLLAKPPAVRAEHELVLNFGYQRDVDGNRINPFPEIFYNEDFFQVSQILPNLEMERRVIERTNPGKDMMKVVTVVIRADAEIPTGLVQELIQKCQTAGFSKFSLRAKTEVL